MHCLCKIEPTICTAAKQAHQCTPSSGQGKSMCKKCGSCVYIYTDCLDGMHRRIRDDSLMLYQYLLTETYNLRHCGTQAYFQSVIGFL